MVGMDDDKADFATTVEQSGDSLSNPTSSFRTFQPLQDISNTSLPKLPPSSSGAACSSSLRSRSIHPSAEQKVTLTPTSAYILILSSVIGSSIFAAPGSILTSAGSPGLALLLWTAGAVLAWCSLCVSIELGASYFPGQSGGQVVYLQRMFGERPRFLVSTVLAVQAAALGFSASNAVVFGKYVAWGLGGAEQRGEGGIMAKGCTAALVLGVSLLHGKSREGGILVQNVLGWIKVGMILFITLSSLVLLATKSVDLKPQLQSTHRINSPQQPLNIWASLWTGSHWDIPSLTSAFLKVSWAYAGADSINNVLGEVRSPTRTIKSVAPLAMLSITVFYLLLNTAYFVVVPLNEAKQGGELIAALFFERVFGTGTGKQLLPALVALSAAGNVMVTTFSQARINQQIARQGFLPFARLVATDSREGTPVGGLVMHLIPSLIVILLPPQEEVYSFILNLKGYSVQLMALAICIGLLRLRNQHKESPTPKKAFRAWSIALHLPIAAYAGFLVAPFVPATRLEMGSVGVWEGSYAMVLLAVIVLAVIYWYIRFKLLPRLRGSIIQATEEQLDDETSITRLIEIPNDPCYEKLGHHEERKL